MSIRVIGIGDNVVDKYLHSGMMYPGGNALNFSVYAKQAGASSAFIGAFGNDDAAKHIQDVLHKLQIDITHCRHYEERMVTPVFASIMAIVSLSPVIKMAFYVSIPSR